MASLYIYIYICLNELMKLKWNHVINISQNKNVFGNNTCNIFTIFAWDNCLKPSRITYLHPTLRWYLHFLYQGSNLSMPVWRAAVTKTPPSKSGSSTLPQLCQHPRRSWEFRHFDNNSLNNNNNNDNNNVKAREPPVGSGMGSYPSTPLVSRRDHTLTRRMLEGNFINSLN